MFDLPGCNSQKVAVMGLEMTSRDLTWLEVTRKWRLTRSHLEVAMEAYKSSFAYVWVPTGLKLAGGGSHMNRKWCHVTGSGSEVTSFGRKSPGSGCKRPISQVLGMFEFLHGCNSQVSVMWLKMTSQTSRDRNWPESDVIWPKVTWKWL